MTFVILGYQVFVDHPGLPRSIAEFITTTFGLMLFSYFIGFVPAFFTSIVLAVPVWRTGGARLLTTIAMAVMVGVLLIALTIRPATSEPL